MSVIVEPDFPDHWKTRHLVGLLDDEAAPVYVLRIWAHCQNRKQWQFSDFPPEALKALCRFPGAANKLESSLASSGFIRRESPSGRGAGVLIVVKWDEYNAALIAAWENGKRGGRKPNSNPAVTHGLPTGKPIEEKREDKKGSDKEKEAAPRPKVTADDVEIPLPLDSPEVRTALGEWLAYKAKRGESYKDASFVAKKLAEFVEAGSVAFVEAVNASIGSNYAGLFPAKGGAHAKSGNGRVGAGQRYRPEAR